jgi:hypothetical protein
MRPEAQILHHAHAHTRAVKTSYPPAPRIPSKRHRGTKAPRHQNTEAPKHRSPFLSVQTPCLYGFEAMHTIRMLYADPGMPGFATANPTPAATQPPQHGSQSPHKLTEATTIRIPMTPPPFPSGPSHETAPIRSFEYPHCATIRRAMLRTCWRSFEAPAG